MGVGCAAVNERKKQAEGEPFGVDHRNKEEKWGDQKDCQPREQCYAIIKGSWHIWGKSDRYRRYAGREELRNARPSWVERYGGQPIIVE